MASAYKETARVFKAFCDENRLQILEMLRSGEKCACKLLEKLQISQSTLSHHMKILSMIAFFVRFIFINSHSEYLYNIPNSIS